MAEVERTTINGQSYLVCAACRYPTTFGETWSPVYAVPQPGLPNPDPVRDKQGLCTPCYLAQYELVYPEAEQPDLPDGKLYDYGPVPRNKPRDVRESTPDERFELWSLAIERVKARGGQPDEITAEYNLLTQQGIDLDAGEPARVD